MKEEPKIFVLSDVTNLFVAQRLGGEHALLSARSVQGYNVRHWSAQGLDFWAVSDLDSEELGEFVHKISAAVRAPSGSSIR
jgi:anti-sigma factor RsiW